MEDLRAPEDPYPKINFMGCMNVLLSRPGITRVHQRGNRGQVIFVDVEVQGSETQTLCLTSQQVKFVVMRLVSNEDMVAERFPAEWPASSGLPTGE
jgi:hypothetical protein